MGEEEAGLEGWTPIDIGGFMGEIGPLLRPVARGAQEVWALRVGARHLNPLGLVHGGVLTSLLDQAVALAAWKAAGRQPVVTVQMDTRFLGAAREGDLLETRATLRHAGGALLFVDAELCAGEAPVAAASAIMKRMSRGASA
ncbi:PaaI family thioesterase [Salipiger bermudensis]|uniref:PaaI family thioesterase n=1 Tax=Salipiger bermudensis TaxID=344736 RepID=UPI001C98E4E3|nr:PaaI family thioesterase [Salipiger bermudensis]MBY6006084.1 PaaI family thioesterase [Salipiger bermudensis]